MRLRILALHGQVRNTSLLMCVLAASTLSAQVFEDGFQRPDGPADGWTVGSGKWNLERGRLVAGPATGGGTEDEQYIFMGNPLRALPLDYTISVDWNFIADSPWVGRHAGVLFGWNKVGSRWAYETTGYLVYWIDRASDHGLSLLRYDEGGKYEILARWDLAEDPPENLRIDLYRQDTSPYDTTIRVFADSVLAIDYVDSRRPPSNGGIAGLWTTEQPGQHVEFDNFRVDGIAMRDEFDRADGPLDGWTDGAGEWNISGGELVAGPSQGGGAAGEQQIFVRTGQSDMIATFDWTFLSAGQPPVGRHAGAFFGWSGSANSRHAAFAYGYLLYWIDRTEDRGLNLLHYQSGEATILHTGTAGPLDSPPRTVRVEAVGTRIRVFGDNALVINLEHDGIRSSRFGLWTWDSGPQHVSFDNVEVLGHREPLSFPCFTTSPRPYVVDRPIAFDASCAVGEFEVYVWDFGDGHFDDEIVSEHTYTSPARSRLVRLQLLGGSSGDRSVLKIIQVDPLVLERTDEFDSLSGSEGWRASAGRWASRDGKLVTFEPTTEEHSIWATQSFSYEPCTPPVARFEFDYEFTGAGTSAVVGRHGGFQFHCDEATTRGSFNGYTLDWIDREADHGLRLTRLDGGRPTRLARAARTLDDPPVHYIVETSPERIRVWGDGTLYADVRDGKHRGGHYGFWTWLGGQEVAIDNLELTATPLTPCFTTDKETIVTGVRVMFDAGCSSPYVNSANITSWEWNFGDGTSASGEIASHVFEQAGSHIVSLTVSGEGGDPTTLTRSVTVGIGSSRQRPGNCNQDGNLDISDGICVLGFLFVGDPPSLPCGDGTVTNPASVALIDHNGDGKLDLSDGIGLLNFLFSGGPPPALGEGCAVIEGCPDKCSDT